MIKFYKKASTKTFLFILLSLLFKTSLNAQTLTVGSGVTGLTTTYIGGQTNIALYGFTINPSLATNLGRVVISHTALSAADLNANFTGTYVLGTCTTSAYSFATFTTVPAAAVVVNANDITVTCNLPLVASTTRFFFLIGTVRTTFIANYPVKVTFSLNNTVTSTFRNTGGVDYVTNAYGRIRNTLIPNLARTEGTAFYWNNIPNTTQNTDLTKTAAVAGIIDGNTTTNITPPSDVTLRLYYQAAGITWPTTKSSIAQLIYYNASFDVSSPTDNDYFHDNVRLQYATNGAASNWVDAAGWTSAPPYPVNRTGNNSAANGAIFTFTGPQLNGVTGLRVIGQLRTDTPGDFYSYALGVREIEVFPVSVYYFKPAQSVVSTLANWGVNEDGTGAVPSSFLEPTQFYFRSNETLDANITSSANTTFSIGAGLDPGVTLTMGTNTISNATVDIPLAITSGSNTLQLAGATAPIISLLSQGALGSTVEYNGGTQTVGNYNYNNLTITNNGTKTLGGATTVNRALIIQTGTAKLALASNTLTLNGTFTGSATNSLSCNGASNLTIGGTGALGTLFFDQTTPGKSFGTSNTDFTALSAGTTNRLNNLVFNRTSSGTVTLGNELQISNTITPTAGTLVCGTPTIAVDGWPANLVMLSTQSLTSSILAIPAGADITGAVNVQSFFKGGSVAANRGYRMISSPIVEVAAPSNFFKKLQERFIITGLGATGNGFDINPNSAPNAPTVQTYLEPGAIGVASFDVLPNISTLTTAGKGYYFFFRGNREFLSTSANNKINRAFVVPEDWTATYIGTINKGDVTYTGLTKSNTDAFDGLNLVGNPYPATLDWSLFAGDLDNNNIDNYISIMTPVRTGFITASGGITNGRLNTTPIFAGGGTASGSLQFIQPGQGFFIRKSNPSNSAAASRVIFKESHKAIATNSPSARRLLSTKETGVSLTAANGKVILAQPIAEKRKLIRLSVHSTETFDDATIVLEEGNDANYSGNDAPYLNNSSVVCYTQTADNVNTCINFMPAVTDVKKIGVIAFSGTTNPNLKLNFDDLTGLGQSDMVLVDSFTNTRTQITATNNSYNFGIDRAVPKSFDKNRFTLVFYNDGLFPVKIGHFNVKAASHTVHLDWNTLSEQNAKSIAVESSADGIHFNTIATLAAKGINTQTENQYSFLDKNPPANGIVYYRLKKISLDGTFKYSEVKNVSFGFAVAYNEVKIYPNPVHTDLNLSWSNQNQSVNIAIYDIAGKMVKHFNNIDSTHFKADMHGLSSGVYVVKLKGTKSNKQIAVNKFVKN